MIQQKYTKPEVDIVYIESTDIITTSAPIGSEGGGVPLPDDSLDGLWL